MKQKLISQNRLKELVYYNPDTGIFTWKVDRTCKAKRGSVAGCKHLAGASCYIDISIDGKQYSAHRLVWLYIHGKFPDNHIDHIDHDGTNNKINNLREASPKINSRNKKLYRSNSSGCVGVSYHRTRKIWQAQINASINLGGYKEKWDAICARKSAEYKYGYHDNHGLKFEQRQTV